ncbi:MAG: cell division topological specificity factor MinE [Pleurocapsa sp.]
MINQILEMLFPWNTNSNSRDRAKSRLKLIIAHDRANINPEMMTSIREEILDVVARYVDVDRNEMEFSLSQDQRITALTANFPIRNVKRLNTLSDRSSASEPSEVLKSQELNLTEPDTDSNNASSDKH